MPLPVIPLLIVGAGALLLGRSRASSEASRQRSEINLVEVVKRKRLPSGTRITYKSPVIDKPFVDWLIARTKESVHGGPLAELAGRELAMALNSSQLSVEDKYEVARAWMIQSAIIGIHGRTKPQPWISETLRLAAELLGEAQYNPGLSVAERYEQLVSAIDESVRVSQDCWYKWALPNVKDADDRLYYMQFWWDAPSNPIPDAGQAKRNAAKARCRGAMERVRDVGKKMRAKLAADQKRGSLNEDDVRQMKDLFYEAAKERNVYWLGRS